MSMTIAEQVHYITMMRKGAGRSKVLDIIEDLRSKLPKWHRCDEPIDGKLYDLPPESGNYFAQYETTWADGTTKRYCEPLEYDDDNCDWPQLTNHCRVIQWCENPIPPEV